MEDTLTILKGCRNFDPRFQKLLYEKHRHSALKVVLRYVFNYEEAVEVVNDGFVKFFLQIDRFIMEDEAMIEKRLTGWIKRIMINTSIDLLRRKMLLPEIGTLPDNTWDIKDESSSADHITLYNELIKTIRRLPPVYRIIFNMHILDGYMHMEIAEALDIPIGTCKSYLLRAKMLLQKYLKQLDDMASWTTQKTI